MRDMKESSADGLARISTYVNEVRRENPNTILVDAGRYHSGHHSHRRPLQQERQSPSVVAAMNYMKYDAWTLGNHEFNWGVDNLKVVMKQSNAPVLAANIRTPTAPSSPAMPTPSWARRREGGHHRRGHPNIPRWDGTKNGVADLKFEFMADAVAAAVKEIGSKGRRHHGLRPRGL